jgi:hypothetical protein
MNTKFVLKSFSVLTILILFLSGVFPGGVQRTVAEGNPSPWVNAYLSENRIDTIGWPLGVNIFLTIIGGGETYSTVQTPTPWYWDNSVGYANFELGPSFTLKPGQVVTISNGPLTKTLTVMDLYVDLFDPLVRTIAGHSDVNAWVRVNVWTANVGYKDDQADATGSWQVEFDSTKPFFPWTNGDVTTWDSDGDATVYHFNMGSINYWPGGDIVLSGVTKYRSYMLTIDDGTDGFWQGYSAIGTTDINGYLPFHFNGPALEVGDVITITSGHDVRSLVITPNGTISFDMENDIISGVNQPNTYIRVMPSGPWEYGRTIKTSASGEWSVNFSMPGQDGEPTVDIIPGMNGGISEYDVDGDNVGYGWHVPNPRFDVRANTNEVQAWEWPIGDELTLVINSQTFTDTVDSWDSGLTFLEFNLSGIDIQSGQIVIVSDKVITKQTVVTPLEFTDIDLGKDTVGGIATPNSSFDIWACGPEGCPTRHVHANNSGYWTADFANPGIGVDEQGTVDLVPGTWVDSRESDSDSDSTMFGMNVPNIHLEIHPQYDLVYALGWDFGDNLTMIITDSLGNYLTEISVIVGEFPWDQNIPAGDFSLMGVDFQPGQVLTVSGNGITMTYQIPDPKLTNIDIIADTISGTGRPGEHMSVAVVLPGGNVYRWTTIDQSGNWMVNYAISDNPDNGAVDLIPGFQVWTDEIDLYWNQTWADDWWIPLPTHGSAVGEGWFNSPAGAYIANPMFTGKVTFEFNAKYEKKSPTLKSTVVFTFKGFNFLSTTLDWLAIQGGRMQLTGSGTVNGTGGYGFMINAANNPAGGGGKDTIRIRIWRTDTGAIIYDNMPGEADYVIPITPIHGGSIKLTP